MNTRITLAALAFIPGITFAENATGIWNAEFDTQIGKQKYSYTLKQEGDKLTGKATAEVRGQTREVELNEGKVEGDKVSFVEIFRFQDMDIRITYTGTVTSADEIKFTRQVADIATEELVAKRVKQ